MRIKSNNTTTVILASASYPLSDTDLKAHLDTYIYTNECLFEADNTSSTVVSRNLHLHTASFVVVSSPSYIDASGDPGAKTDRDHRASPARGTNSANVYFSSGLFDISKTFGVKALGGNGGEGYSAVDGDSDPAGGNGGDGGDGGFVSLIYNDTFSYALQRTSSFLDEKDKQRKAQKFVAWLQFLKLYITYPSTVVDYIKTFTDGYKSMSTSDVDNGVDHICKLLDGQSDVFHVKNTIEDSGGYYGMAGDGKPRGHNGKKGKKGPAYEKLRMTTKTLRKHTELMFHPDQVAMTLRDIENDYYLATQESLVRCGYGLRTLIERLSFLDELVSTDPLYIAYKDHEADIFVVKSGKDEPTSIVSLRGSLSKARSYAAQLSRGMDFYNKSPSWVPRGSFKFYHDQIKDVLDDFADVEKNYDDYNKKLATQDEKVNAIKSSQAKANTIIGRATSGKSYLEKDMKSAADTIATLSPMIKGKRESLANAIDKLSDAIKNHYDVPFSKFVEAAAMCAFAPGMAMGSIQLAGIINSGIAEATDDMGAQVNKDYLVNKVMAIAGDIEGLKEGLTMETGSDTITIDDPNAAKLLLAEKDLLGLIGMYRKLLGDGVLKKIKIVFDNYVATVLTRNNAVIHYNVCVTLWLQADRTIKEQNRQLQMLGDANLSVDYELPGIALFVEQAYFDTAGQVLYLLYVTERALSFWSLEVDSPELGSLRGSGFYRSGLSAALKQVGINLNTAYNRAIETSTSHRQAFGSVPNGQGGTDESTPVRLYLDEYQLDELRTEGEVLLSIPEVYPETARVDSPFSGYADVRLAKVRFYIEGAKTGDDTLLVALEHLAKDTMVNPDGLAFYFTHSVLRFMFQYNVKTKAIQMDGDITSSEYAPLGPFSLWRVKVSDPPNDASDLSTISSAWFEFSGWARSFS